MKTICKPAKLYLIISVIFLIFAVFHQISALTLVMKGGFILIWTMVLNWLCSKGFSGLAWIIVVLPFLAIFITMFTTMDLINGGVYEGFYFKEAGRLYDKKVKSYEEGNIRVQQMALDQGAIKAIDYAHAKSTAEAQAKKDVEQHKDKRKIIHEKMAIIHQEKKEKRQANSDAYQTKITDRLKNKLPLGITKTKKTKTNLNGGQ